MKVAQLCQKVANLVGRHPRLQNVNRGQYRHAIQLAQITPFLNSLSANDRSVLNLVATATHDKVKPDHRSQIIPLEQPIQSEGREILSLRLKGVYPRVTEDGKVKPYVEGNGYLKRIMEPAGETRVAVRMERDASEISPYGSLRLERLTKEIETALILGPKMTDQLLGFGVYEDLRFDQQPIGFLIYGMERKEDVRMIGHLSSHVRQTGRLPEAEDQAIKSGSLLRSMHDQELIHGFPHMGNYAVIGDRSARLLDLDATVKLGSVPAEDRAAYLYLDLSRAINDYQRHFLYEDIYDGEVDYEYVPSTPLLPFFLWGYFRADISMPFVKMLQEFVVEPQSVSRLLQRFGDLPEFGNGWRQGNDFTLIEPTVRLYSMREPGQIDLQDFTSNPLFAQFFEALQIVAGMRAS